MDDATWTPKSCRAKLTAQIAFVNAIGTQRLVPPSGSCDSALREGTKVV
jgi:hypothetical protein